MPANQSAQAIAGIGRDVYQSRQRFREAPEELMVADCIWLNCASERPHWSLPRVKVPVSRNPWYQSEYPLAGGFGHRLPKRMPGWRVRGWLHPVFNAACAWGVPSECPKALVTGGGDTAPVLGDESLLRQVVADGCCCCSSNKHVIDCCVWIGQVTERSFPNMSQCCRWNSGVYICVTPAQLTSPTWCSVGCHALRCQFDDWRWYDSDRCPFVDDKLALRPAFVLLTASNADPAQHLSWAALIAQWNGFRRRPFIWWKSLSPGMIAALLFISVKSVGQAEKAPASQISEPRYVGVKEECYPAVGNRTCGAEESYGGKSDSRFETTRRL